MAKQLDPKETVAKAVNAALEPLRGAVWAYEEAKQAVYERVVEKLKHVPPERIKTSDPRVVGPTLEALKFAGQETRLREMYANLLATSLDSEMAHNAHPSFVQIIDSLSPDEARIMEFMAARRDFPTHFPVIDVVLAKGKGRTNIITRCFSLLGEQAACEHPNLVISYADNLCRLGLVEIPAYKHLAEPGLYEPLEIHELVNTIREQYKNQGEVKIERGVLRPTDFGVQFCQACVIEKAAS